jgi:hypothetical protein
MYLELSGQERRAANPRFGRNDRTPAPAAVAGVNGGNQCGGALAALYRDLIHLLP